jgi:CRP/FNR family transcriptional regulator, cyclic AMP receptor protein
VAAGGIRQWPATSVLGSLPPGARGRLLALGVLARYTPARVIIREADSTTFVVILLTGMVKVTAHAGEGREALLAIRVGGDLVGEFAGIDDQSRSATVTAGGPVTARVVSRADFLDCLNRDAQITHAVNQSVVAKLRVATQYRLDFIGHDTVTRLARVLYHIAITYGDRRGDAVTIGLPITQQELATLCGASEPSIQKAFRELRAAGAVKTGYRQVTVSSLEVLGRLALTDDERPR